MKNRVFEPKVTEQRFSRMSRRELLKLAPLAALGAFAVPRWQGALLKEGLKFSDWTAAKMFRTGHLAPTFADSQVVPFDKFPLNFYYVADPGVILENWTLTISGAVSKPGEYTMAQIQS